MRQARDEPTLTHFHAQSIERIYHTWKDRATLAATYSSYAQAIRLIYATIYIPMPAHIYIPDSCVPWHRAHAHYYVLSNYHTNEIVIFHLQEYTHNHFNAALMRKYTHNQTDISMLHLCRSTHNLASQTTRDQVSTPPKGIDVSYALFPPAPLVRSACASPSGVSPSTPHPDSAGAPEPVRQGRRTPDQCSRQKVEINAHVRGISNWAAAAQAVNTRAGRLLPVPI